MPSALQSLIEGWGECAGMNRPKRYNLIVGLPLGFMMAGCTGLNRPDFGLRTTPSLGDRPLAVVNGRPGEDRIIRTETESASAPATNDARRISGRVIDHRGQPVSGATVRLADGALNGGQVSDVTTDEAGGFTIRGLRSSTPYTMIASLDLGGEARVGRARFLSGETQARILLEPESSAATDTNRPGGVTPARTATTSVEPAASPESTPVAQPKVPAGRWVYVVDGESAGPADSAKFASAATKNQAERISRANYIPEVDANVEPEAAPEPQSRRTPPKNTQWWPRQKNDGVAQAEKRDNSILRAQYSGDEETNPLPPAIERKAYVYEEFQEAEPQPVRRIASAAGRPGVVASTGNITEDMLPLREIPLPAEEVIEAEDDRRPAPVARRQQGRSATQPRSSRDMTYVDYPSAANLRVEDIDEANRLRRAARSAGSTVPSGRYDDNAAPDPRRSARWQEAQRDTRPDESAPTDSTISLANRSGNALVPPPDLPPVEFTDRQPPADARNLYFRGMERSANQRAQVERALNSSPTSGVLAQIEPDVARSDQERIDRLKASQTSSDPAFNGDSPRTSNEWLNRMTGKLSAWTKPVDAKAALGINSAFCDFDTANQRLLDFELLNVQGKPERFSQMPSDLTLVFFWGTWCKPCHEAMPHLVELQKQLASDNFQIVGIAYEEGNVAERQKKVAMAADRYGINFPLLMGNSAGAESCPVRRAFEVRVYPTMVLLDREGRILWKDQGITPASLGRLDRVLASHLRELDAVKYARADNGRTTR